MLFLLKFLLLGGGLENPILQKLEIFFLPDANEPSGRMEESFLIEITQKGKYQKEINESSTHIQQMINKSL